MSKEVGFAMMRKVPWRGVYTKPVLFWVVGGGETTGERTTKTEAPHKTDHPNNKKLKQRPRDRGDEGEVGGG